MGPRTASNSDLAQAIVTLDREIIATSIGKVALSEPALAAALKQLNDRFAYTALLDLVADKHSEHHPTPVDPSPLPETAQMEQG